MSVGKMLPAEWRAVTSLSTIMALRMVGLFMVLPIFSLYASQLSGATPLLIGLSLGIYGLFQALFQIPLGVLSDRFGRKPIIALGLLVFAVGSIIAAWSNSIFLMIIGRSLQGAAAVGSTILASIADLTREDQRTKCMAIAGISIGFSFSLAMLLGPLLIQWLSIANLFNLAALFAFIGIGILYTAVPNIPDTKWQRDAEPELKGFLKLLIMPELAKLNLGIFILHAIFTASFVAIPLSLKALASPGREWVIYLPTLLVAFSACLFLITLAERQQRIKSYFLTSILLLAIAELSLLFGHHLTFMLMSLCLFFFGFSMLESFLPSLVSRTAPAHRKGTALGIYSCAQFSGIFVGGIMGGWLYGLFSFSGVYIFCSIAAFCWFALALTMRPPRHLSVQSFKLSPSQLPHWDVTRTKLQSIAGIHEVTFIAEDSMAYLKMDREVTKNPEYIKLKNEILGV